MKYLHLIIILFTLSIIQICYAQKLNKEDSLIFALSTSKEDTNKVNILNLLSEHAGWRVGNYDTALLWAEQAQMLAEKLNYKKGITTSYNNMGIVYYNQGNYAEALNNHFAALKIFREIGYKKGIASCYNNIGNVYSNQGKYAEALKNYFASLKIYEEIEDKQRDITNAYTNIGIVYYMQGNYTEALKNYLTALEIREKIDNKQGIETANIYINIGNVYYMQGNYTEALKNYFVSLKIYEEIDYTQGISYVYNCIGIVYYNQGNYAEVLKNLLAALKIKEKIGDKYGIALTHNNIGGVYFGQGNYFEALKSYFASLKIREEIMDKEGMAICYNNIGEVYNQKKQAAEAKQWLQKGLGLACEIGSNNVISVAYKNLAAADSALGNYKEAYANYKQYIIYRDSLYNEENTKKLVQTQMQYDFDKKEAATQAAFEKTQDSIKLEQEKELALKQLKYEYEKKRAMAKSEQERQKLIFEEELKRQEIESNFKQKQAQKQAEYDRKTAVAKAAQDKKDAVAASELKRKNLQRNASIGGLILMLLLAGVFFTQRNRISKEKQRSEALLLNILPSEVAEELKEHGESEAKYFDEVSVLFTDFVDFTVISESLLPKELVKELHTCFKAFDDIITRHGLEKIKTIGDAYMAVCGLPLPNVHHAQHTVKAAQEIVQFMEKRKQENPNGFQIRIGINSGSVVAGIVGVKKFAYDIWGDTVNTAARMESNGEAGRINISGNTYELVKNDFNCEYRGKIKAKGKGEVDMYFVA